MPEANLTFQPVGRNGLVTGAPTPTIPKEMGPVTSLHLKIPTQLGLHLVRQSDCNRENPVALPVKSRRFHLVAKALGTQP